MNVFGATTSHILDVDYLSRANRKHFDLRPSLNGWYTGVDSWVSSASALKQAGIFLRHVEAQIKDLYIGTVEEFSVESGNTRRVKGVLCHEKMLMGRIRDQWEVFAKVDIAYGPENAIDEWDSAERAEWFNHSMV